MTAATVNPAPLLEKVSTYLPPDRVQMVERAYAFAAEKHAPQKRKNGDPYIIHPLDAAITIAKLQLDANTVAAALLHDVQEDCHVPPEELAREFNPEVARMVEGATKLEGVKLRSEGGADQAENLRKMFLAMAEDPRVVIVKLADRLHNMRTLDHMSEEHRQRKARETMEIFAPLANRMGIWQIKWELEDLAFRHLDPEQYRRIAALVNAKRTTREDYIDQVTRILSAELDKHGIKAEISGRAKHIYSIYQKIKKYEAQGKTFSEIYDLLALRVILDSDNANDCYQVLGIVHGLWTPVPNQFDDYIAKPKDTGYQSLHTTVLCLAGRPLEVQIRTRAMHDAADLGVAAHWQYKEGVRDGKVAQEQVAWLRQLLEWQRDLGSSEEFVETVRHELFQDQVFVYTPKGDVKDLPAGATPLDFAFRIHTDLGYRCTGAKVNGRLVSLNQPLRNGDVVEIIASKTSRGPSRDWLNANLGYVKTTHARQKIRQWFKRQSRQENLERGRVLVDRELRRLGLSIAEVHDDLRRLFHVETMDEFFIAIGDGTIGTERIARMLAPLIEPEEPALPAPAPLAPPRQMATGQIHVLGAGDLVNHLANCCTPVPGDQITGFITRSRGVAIHRDDCANIRNTEEPERLVEVSWGDAAVHSFAASIRVEAIDRVGLLHDVTAVVAEERVNITDARVDKRSDGTTFVLMTVDTSGVEQLTRVMARLEQVRGVLNVTRDRARRRATPAHDRRSQAVQPRAVRTQVKTLRLPRRQGGPLGGT